MNRDTDAEQYTLRARQSNEGLMFDTQPDFIELNLRIQTRQISVRMLVQFGRTAQAPVGTEPGDAGTQFGEEAVDLAAESWIETGHDTVDEFDWMADFFS